MKNIWLSICLLTFLAASVQAQDKNYKVMAVGFYNLENLFDTLDTENVRDTEFTPKGEKGYTSEIYNDKLDKLAKVVSSIGTEMTNDGLAILGVAEIENRSVLEDFVKHPDLEDRNYQIVHYDSPDKRGIDVGLLYNPKYFTVKGSKNINPNLFRDGDTVFTRDILWVEGEMEGEIVHVFVNHWPSRRGGEKASSPLRQGAAKACKAVVDSLTEENPNVKIIIMGDMNDDPTNASMKSVLQAKRKKEQVKDGQLFNPWWDFYAKGYGTLAYRDSWNLFDQVVVSSGWLEKEQKGWFFHKAEIFKRDYMFQKEGRYKGYPLRTYVGTTYMGGYSDHFPAYIYLLKEVE